MPFLHFGFANLFSTPTEQLDSSIRAHHSSQIIIIFM